jgi:hypothetical protein
VGAGQSALFTWGRGKHGTLGHGGVGDEASPRALATVAGARRTVYAVACGPESTAAVLSPAVRTAKEKAAMSKKTLIYHAATTMSASGSVGAGVSLRPPAAVAGVAAEARAGARGDDASGPGRNIRLLGTRGNGGGGDGLRALSVEVSLGRASSSLSAAAATNGDAAVAGVSKRRGAARVGLAQTVSEPRGVGAVSVSGEVGSIGQDTGRRRDDAAESVLRRVRGEASSAMRERECLRLEVKELRTALERAGSSEAYREQPVGDFAGRRDGGGDWDVSSAEVSWSANAAGVASSPPSLSEGGTEAVCAEAVAVAAASAAVAEAAEAVSEAAAATAVVTTAAAAATAAAEVAAATATAAAAVVERDEAIATCEAAVAAAAAAEETTVALGVKASALEEKVIRAERELASLRATAAAPTGALPATPTAANRTTMFTPEADLAAVATPLAHALSLSPPQPFTPPAWSSPLSQSLAPPWEEVGIGSTPTPSPLLSPLTALARGARPDFPISPTLPPHTSTVVLAPSSPPPLTSGGDKSGAFSNGGSHIAKFENGFGHGAADGCGNGHDHAAPADASSGSEAPAPVPASVSASVSEPGGPPGSPTDADAVAAVTAAVAAAGADNGDGGEWVEEVEPGVFMTIVVDTESGQQVLKRVRFSRRVFSDGNAQSWWEKNRVRIIRARGLRLQR